MTNAKPDFLSLETVAQLMDYSSIAPVKELIKIGKLTAVYPIPKGKPRIHIAQWQQYVKTLNPIAKQNQVIDQDPIQAAKELDDLLKNVPA